MSDSMTRAVRVQVASVYLPDRSSPERHHYFFAYHVIISNDGDEPVTLEARHWIITDGAGRVEEVKGAGVVGEQPRILPGESFAYTSACPLPTPVGTMQGSYRMKLDTGERFEVPIEPFTLACPEALN